MGSEFQSESLPDSRSVELVIFDCDGVLIDSEIISAEVLSQELAALGVQADSAYILQHFLGISYTSMAQQLRRNLNVRLPADFKSHYRDRLLIAFEERLRTTPGVETVLADLNVASCVATSSSPTRTRRALELAHLTDHFGANVFTASQVTNGKPAPDLFLHAANKMKVEPGKCLVVEDSPAGLSAATAAGMTTCQYVGGSHMRTVNHQLPGTLSRILILESWDKFYEMAPGLRKNPTAETTNDD